MRKQRHVPFEPFTPRNHPIGSAGYLVNGLTIWTRMGPDGPIRHFFPDLFCGYSLVITVVPFAQIIAQFYSIFQASQMGGFQGTLQRATDDCLELHIIKNRTKKLGLRSASLSQRYIGPASMPAIPGPLCFPVSNEIDLMFRMLRHTGDQNRPAMDAAKI